MTQGTLEIHSENILPIIKKWMYSDKEIFVRELVSNACDAVHKVKRLRDAGKTDFSDDEMRIDITISKEASTLTFADTGIGMDAEEVVKYIAQIAFSGAEDFVEKYQSKAEGDQIIGHFGLGFYSSYMVADRVSIDSLSYKEGAEAINWECDGSPEYSLDQGKREKRGTAITLHIAEDEKEFLEEERLKEILRRYCSFLPCPLFLNETQINTQPPLWMKAPSECTEQEYLDFYRHLYPMEPDPLFWIHLNVDYPFHLQGILYFPKFRRDMEERKGSIQLYCNRVFVSDDCKDLIPEFLLQLRGVIDSPDIPLNVSRSYLQVDRTVRQLGGHVAKKVADRLANLYSNDKERFFECWKDIEVVVKLGVMQDDKFYKRVKELLVFQTTKGEWTTTEEYLERNKEKTKDKIFYTSDEKEDTPFSTLYEDQGIEVLRTRPLIDGMLINFLERELSPAKFQRVDGAMDDSLLDPSREKSVLDADGRTEASKLASFFKKLLGEDKVEIEAKSLKSDDMPAVLIIDEERRRMRDYLAATNPDFKLDDLMAMNQPTLVLNTNHPLITTLPKLSEKNPEKAKELVQHLYELTLLSQREMTTGMLASFIKRSQSTLTDLAQTLSE